MKARSGAVACVVAVVTIGAAGIAHGYALRGQVLGNGGRPMANATRRIDGTAGQPAAGVSGGVDNTTCHGFWCFGGSRVTAVDDPPPGADPGAGSLPLEFAFEPARPNPSRGALQFRVALPSLAHVRVTIHDVAGREVARPYDGTLPPGWHVLPWRHDRSGAGVHWARLTLDGAPFATRRVILLR